LSEDFTSLRASPKGIDLTRREIKYILPEEIGFSTIEAAEIGFIILNSYIHLHRKI
jgi:hypothetical protein